jgi:hypothetical protein
MDSKAAVRDATQNKRGSLRCPFRLHTRLEPVSLLKTLDQVWLGDI